VKDFKADQLSFEIMIENSYSFQKHSFSTTNWLTSDPGSGVRGTCLNKMSTLDDAWIHRASGLPQIGCNVTIKTMACFQDGPGCVMVMLWVGVRIRNTKVIPELETDRRSSESSPLVSTH